MAKFAKKKDGDVPAVSTASLPDIVFMLLFFFMTVTTMKDSTLLVDNELPNASEIKKLENGEKPTVGLMKEKLGYDVAGKELGAAMKKVKAGTGK